MKLSVVVPAYNLENYIGSCLLSLLEQDTDFDYEVIVCDDASTDNTAEKVSEIKSLFPDKLVPIFKTKNEGLAANMKTLLAQVKGEYVAYLDGDDIALPSKLQKQVDYLDSHLDCIMVFHESDMFDSETDKSIKLYSQEFYNWELIPVRSSLEHLVQYGTYMQASSVMFRNHDSLLKTVSEQCEIIFDYNFYIQNAGFLNGYIDFIPETLGRYRIHENSFGQQTSRSCERREQSLLDIELACYSAEQFGLPKSVINLGIAHHRFAASLYFLFRDFDDLFLKHIEHSFCDGNFFNKTHALAYEKRHSPKKLKHYLAKGE